ncbi:MAG: hypothetical protein K1X83_03655 [Oligoflexia bacterium]|nr:hypothetical protein [Oligoflexia bacterium]
MGVLEDAVRSITTFLAPKADALVLAERAHHQRGDAALRTMRELGRCLAIEEGVDIRELEDPLRRLLNHECAEVGRYALDLIRRNLATENNVRGLKLGDFTEALCAGARRQPGDCAHYFVLSLGTICDARAIDALADIMRKKDILPEDFLSAYLMIERIYDLAQRREDLPVIQCCMATMKAWDPIIVPWAEQSIDQMEGAGFGPYVPMALKLIEDARQRMRSR